MSKAPDKIYAVNIAGTLYASNKPQEVFREPYSEYIRKETLMEWLKEKKEWYEGCEDYEKAFRMMIDKLKSL